MPRYDRVRWLLAIPLAVVTTTTLIAARPAAPRPACLLAADWLAAHTNKLPTSLAEMDKLPMLYRRIAYRMIPAESRIRIWREKLEPLLEPSQGLTRAQRELVMHVIDELPLLAGDSTGAIGRQVIAKERLDIRLVEAFGHDRYIALFTTIGTARSGVTESSEPPSDWCNCSVYGNVTDCWLSSCHPSGDCIPLRMACGSIGNDDCDGACSE